VVLRQRGEPEISEIETMASLDGEVIKDIFMCWSNIHGYAHLRLEGQLNSLTTDYCHPHPNFGPTSLVSLWRQMP
jgi:hypothetical protein